MLTSEMDKAIAILSRGCEGIEAVMSSNLEANRFTNAFEDLQRLSTENQIPIAIVGGLAAIRYGYSAATQDIDIAISKRDLETLVHVASRYGFKVVWESKIGWHTLTHGDVEINVVPEGGRARDSSPTEIPGPTEMGVMSGMDYARIESWVELKISSGRQKDLAHIVEVLKKSEQPTIKRIIDHLEHTNESYKKMFDGLLVEAVKERQQEQNRR
jgi:thiamine biosynthesis protein ThiC